MDKNFKKLLVELTEAPGAPGYEGKIKEIMRRELEGHYDSVEEDKIGNIIFKKGSGSPVYMIAAHMDEIALIIRHIDDKGFVWFVPMGGFYDPTIIGMKVKINTDKGDVNGTVGGKPPHLMEREEMKKIIQWKDLYIDVGVDSAEEAKALGLRVGQPITFNQTSIELAGNRFAGKAMDNRVGVMAMIDMMKRLKNFKGTVYAVGTVQEEVGVKGAKVASFKIKPDYAFVLDVTMAGGEPMVKPQESNLMMGKGLTIIYAESGGRGLIANPKLNQSLIDVAEAEKIPYQLEATSGGMTDAAAIYITGEGTPTASIGIPTRNIHTPVSIMDADDVEAAGQLLAKAIEKGINI